MLESIITITLLGLFAGFFFSMPVAGPISIVVVSNALKGNLRFCLRTALGASIAEMFYVFAAISGISVLYTNFKFVIPYVIIGGSLFLIFVAYKVTQTKMEIDNVDDGKVKRKPKDSGGFRTGFILNATNPSLFINWLAASFMLFSFASSIGLNTGGLNFVVQDNVESIKEIADEEFEELNFENTPHLPEEEPGTENSNFSLFLGGLYALGEAFGTYFWFSFFSRFLIKHRSKVNVKFINIAIKLLGIVLFGMAGFLIYKAITLIF